MPLPKVSDFKVIYGVEAYLVDDLKEIVGQLQKVRRCTMHYVVFDYGDDRIFAG